jgi:hypothetical protein
MATITRRSLVAGATAFGLPAIIVRPTLAADYSFKQYHNQTAAGTLQRNLVAMWVRSDGNQRPGRSDQRIRRTTRSRRRS